MSFNQQNKKRGDAVMDVLVFHSVVVKKIIVLLP